MSRTTSERAEFDVRTVAAERVAHHEGTVATERAGIRKSTEEPERAMWCESAVGRERTERLCDRRVTNWSGVTDPAAKPGPVLRLKEGTERHGGGDGDDDFVVRARKLTNRGPLNVEADCYTPE